MKFLGVDVEDAIARGFRIAFVPALVASLVSYIVQTGWNAQSYRNEVNLHGRCRIIDRCSIGLRLESSQSFDDQGACSPQVTVTSIRRGLADIQKEHMKEIFMSEEGVEILFNSATD